MSLQSTLKTSRIIETLENYAIADNFKATAASDTAAPNQFSSIYTDQRFWDIILKHQDDAWNKGFEFRDVGLSEWIARVPGLFYSDGSERLRKQAESKVEYVSDKWRHYNPLGKSEKVMGGIGTICLPSEDNYYLASISFTNNASTGIPVLISEEIWNYHKLKEGVLIRKLEGTWKKMKSDWSQRFPSTANIPKGYIEVSKPEDIEVEQGEILPTLYHPFSIMEYEKDGSLFYDFVYVTVDSTEENFRDKIRCFFGEYEYFENRNGRYLIEPFVNNPLLNNVQYQSPKDLRANSREANSHLDLMLSRIRKEMFNDQTLEAIKIGIDNHCDIDTLKRMSTHIGLNPNRWFTGGAVVNESAALLNYCQQRGKVEELVDLLVFENSEMLKDIG